MQEFAGSGLSILNPEPSADLMFSCSRISDQGFKVCVRILDSTPATLGSLLGETASARGSLRGQRGGCLQNKRCT